MADFDPQKLVTLLTTHKASLASTEADQDKILKEATARLGGRSSDDMKEAAKLAVETAKSFITLGTAVLIAVGTFIQFARNGGIPWDSWVIYLFGLAAVSVLFSLLCGFFAISKIYKRAEGRRDVSLPAWSTAAVKHQLDAQANLGIVGLLLLVAGLTYWGTTVSKPPATIEVKTPEVYARLSSVGPLSMKGDWTTMKFMTPSGQELSLLAKSQPVEFSCR